MKKIKKTIDKTLPPVPELVEKDYTLSNPDTFGEKKLIQNKFEYDLFRDEDNKKEKILRVKRFNSPAHGEKWKIFEDTKVVEIIDASKLTKKEVEYLRTVEGFNFIINHYKAGMNSFNAFKKELKNKLTQLDK